MAQQKFGGKEFNSTNATLEETAYLGGPVPGFVYLGPFGNKVTRAYVKEAGAKFPVAVTEGDGEFSAPTLRLRQSQARVFLDQLRDRSGVESDLACMDLELTFIVTYRPQDEERTPDLPSEVYTFNVYLGSDGERTVDRGSADGLMVEFPLIPTTPVE